MIDNEDFITRNLKILREQIKHKPNPYIFTAEEVKLKKIEFVARDMLKALSDGEMVELKEFLDRFIQKKQFFFRYCFKCFRSINPTK